MFPNLDEFKMTKEEKDRAEIARLAVMLHITPSEIRAMTVRDLNDILAVIENNKMRQAVK